MNMTELEFYKKSIEVKNAQIRAQQKAHHLTKTNKKGEISDIDIDALKKEQDLLDVDTKDSQTVKHDSFLNQFNIVSKIGGEEIDLDEESKESSG